MSQSADGMSRRRGARGRLVGLMGVIVTGAVVLAGCDQLLDVDLPGDLAADALAVPPNAEMLANSAQAQFECFFANYAVANALWTDEAVTGSQRAGRQFWMTRGHPPIWGGRGTGPCESTSQGNAYTPMDNHYRSWANARDYSRFLEEWSDDEVVGNRIDLLARTRAYAAYSLMLFGESHCAGAVLEPNDPVSTPREVMAEAAEWWTRTFEAANQVGNQEIAQLALVGQARVKLWQRDPAAAADIAEQVVPGFRYDATYEEHPERENHVATEMGRDAHVSVFPELTGIPQEVDGVPDPRMALVDRGRTGVDGRTPIWASVKALSRSDPIRMASWEEAQLIVAEGRLGPEAVAIINTLRDQHGLPAYVPADVSDDEEILDQVLEERRRELFLEGHRINDLLRHFDRPSIRNAWPEGQTHDGDPIHERYCLWFLEEEVNANPNVSSADIPDSMHPDVMRR